MTGCRMGGMRCIISAVWLDMVAARSGILMCDCEVIVCERPAMAGLAPKMFAKAASLAPPVGCPYCGGPPPCWFP